MKKRNGIAAALLAAIFALCVPTGSVTAAGTHEVLRRFEDTRSIALPDGADTFLIAGVSLAK